MNIEDSGEQQGWLFKLKAGLERSSQPLTQGLNKLLVKRKLDGQVLEELESLLIAADLGVKTATNVVSKLAATRLGKDVNPKEVRTAIADEISEILTPIAQPLWANPAHKPHVVLVCGVNGSGKTTTIGKLAHILTGDGKFVQLVAGDTFRAAAVEQLKIWGERTGCPVISGNMGSDAAGLAFDALQQSQKDGADVLLVDTAGRLQNKTEFMAELQKIIRVMQKIDENAPHSRLLVLDATVGQNAHSQVETFSENINVTGLVLTKLDGSAKGGVIVALAQKYGIPVHAIGVGEHSSDLQPFKAAEFAHSLLDLEI